MMAGRRITKSFANAAAVLLAAAFLAGPAMAMDEAAFQQAMTTGERTDLTRPQRALAFDTVLARKDLTTPQKAEAYWRRALFRAGDGADQMDAIADYRQSASFNPGDARIAPALAYMEQTVAETQARLTAEDSIARADDLYQLGRWKEAYAIWKAMVKIGYYPSEIDIRRMVDDQVLCKPKGRGQIDVPAGESYGHGDLVICTL